MVIISKTKLITFFELEQKAQEPILEWYYKTLISDWDNFHSVKETFNSVDSVGKDRYVFNAGATSIEL